MNKADRYLIDNIKEILSDGTIDENPRPKYESDGKPAHSLFITQVFEKYNIQAGEFPITELRPILFNKGISEVQWIFQDQTSDLNVLRDKHDIHWWDSWSIDDGETIGQRYGATVKRYDLMNRLLKSLIEEPFSRRHIINLWQERDFQETDGLLPCAFQIMVSVRKSHGEYYIDLTLTQRSSDYLVAGHINKMQYVALQMMISKHCGYKVGKFAHFIQNLHIYTRHLEQAKILLNRSSFFLRDSKPKLILDVPDKTNFYDINVKDFKMVDYNPVKPNLKFELGI